MNLKDYSHLTQVFFIGQSYFDNDRTQLYLVFQTIYKTIITFSSPKETISEWEPTDCQMKNLRVLM